MLKKKLIPFIRALVCGGILFIPPQTGAATVESGEAARILENLPEKRPATSWSFGHSGDRGAAIWKKGMNADAIKTKSVPAMKKMPGAADTRKGIDSAISKARHNKSRGSMGVSLEDASSSWKTTPQAKGMRADEDMARDRKHVLRAYAGVNPTDDLNISIGPELILRDENQSEQSAHSSQPDSVFGLGMKFKLDF